MKHLLIIASIICFGLYAQAKDNDRALPKKSETATASYPGTWKPVSAVLGGAALPEPAVKAITLKMSGDQYEVTIQGRISDKGTRALDS